MVVVQINVTAKSGSTGKICRGIKNVLEKNGDTAYILNVTDIPSDKYEYKYQNKYSVKINALVSRVLGNVGFDAVFSTKRLIGILKRINPDIIHLHNLHSHNCNLKLFFDYIKKENKKVVWTFHDCWAFTGYCTHFLISGCDKWKTECNDCPIRKSVSWFLDKSKYIFDRKKELLSGIDLTVVTPSEWLKGIVEQSFLKNYPVKVINNGIDLDVFNITKSDFKSRHGLEDKFILLGVAFNWGYSKGLDVFIKLNEILDKEKYQIVLIGTDDNVDRQLPKSIISIHRTANQKELAEIYSASDLLVNPTREDTFPTVNIESLACGTPVLTFRTGGSPEIIDEKTGSVVDVNDVDALEKEIIRISNNKPYSSEDCRKRAENYNQAEKFKEYLGVYRAL